jgi:predicted TIM-barrel fold metal-dependent hydrolase
MLPIIDTHQHLWDLSRLDMPWLESAPTLNRSYVTSDYLAATAGLNVVKAVYMEVDVTAAQKVGEAEHLIELCAAEDNPTVGAVIGGSVTSADFAGYIRRFAGSPVIKGVRQVLHGAGTPQGTCLAPQFVENVRLLGELELCFDLCMRPSELGDGVKLALQCPETRFVVDHCGNGDPYLISGVLPGSGGTDDAGQADSNLTIADHTDRDDPYWHDRQQWMDGIEALAALPNTICKISGIIARTRPGWRASDLAPAVNHCLDSFGPDRVVFGGDWPVCTLGADATYRAWVEALKEIIADRSETEQRKLLHDNAATFYGLV